MYRFTELGIGWQVGVASGWGTYGVNLAVEASKRGVSPALFFRARELNLTEDQAVGLAAPLARYPHWREVRNNPVELGFPMLHGLGDKLDFPDILHGLKGRPEFGVVFFESATIPPANIEAARRFAAIITGSSWNAEILERRGLTVRNVLQGIDPALFYPAPRRGQFAGRFAIFSGGKLEYRKGQDLVVAAFKRFHARHPDALLIAAWHSPWPEAAERLAASPHVKGAPPIREGRIDIAAWLQAQGLPAESFLDVGALANATTAQLLREVDVALMPSRCEGGTNLVAMECMACGVPTILSRNTGHLDLIRDDNCYALDFQIPMGEVTGRADLEGWGESSIEEIVNKLEQAYTDRADAQKRGNAAAVFMKEWSWSAQIEKMLGVINDFI